jgi:rhamnulokinase
MSEPKFVACDFGAESGRLMLGRLRDRRLTLEQIHRFPNRQVRLLGHLHWDLLDLFANLKEGLSKAAQLGHDRLTGIGVDTWGVDFGMIDRSGQLLGFPYVYRDARTDGMMDAAFRKMSRADIYSITGIQFMALNTLYQLMSTTRARPDLVRASDRILFMPDLFHYLLTGVMVSEYTISSTSQLLDARTRTWSERLFEGLDLPLRLMPQLIEPGTEVGPLLPEIVSETGVEARVIAPACHDTASAVAAVPASGENWAYLSSGTWSLLGIESPEPIISEASLQRNFTNEGGFGGTIRFLRNNMGLWLLERCKRSWEAQGSRLSYDDLVELGRTAPRFRSAFDPDAPVFLNPPDMPTAIAEYCREHGQSVPESQGDFTRAIFESLVLKYRYIVENINKLRGKAVSRLHIVGGGSRNRLLNQLTADALGIEVIAGPAEATATGNILIQAIGSGLLESLDEARELVRNSFAVEYFEPRETAAWDTRYDEVRKLFE